MFEFNRASRIEQLTTNLEDIKDRLAHFKTISQSYMAENDWSDPKEREADFYLGFNVFERMNNLLFNLLTRVTICKSLIEETEKVRDELSSRSEFVQWLKDKKCPENLFSYMDVLIESAQDIIADMETALKSKNISKALSLYVQLFRLC
jgi:hypothetical protein